MPADQTTTLNNLAADPDFLKLSDDEQKVILGKVRGSVAAPAPKFSLPAGVSMMGPSNQGRVPDSVIDMLRPLVSGAAGAGGAALGGPVGAVAGYGGADAILQHLKSKADNGMVASAIGMESGGLASTLTNTAEQYGLGKIGDALVSRAGAAVKAFKNVDQPEIAKFLPTTSQALESGGYSKLAAVSKAAEDLAVGNKNRALNRTAGAGFAEQLDLLKRNELPAFENPQDYLTAAQKDMPFGEGSMVPVKFNDTGRGYQPISIKPNSVPYTPIKVQGVDTEVTPITIKPGDEYKPLRKGQPYQPSTQPEVIPGQTKSVASGTTETIPGQERQVADGTYRTIPGQEKTLPGGQIQAQYGTPKTNTGAESFSALDKVINDPAKLQETLSRATELGTGDNLRRTLAGYKFSDIMNKAATRDATGNVVKLDPSKIAEEWSNPELQESYSKLFSNKNKADIDQFFKNITQTQDKISVGSYRKMWLMEGGVALGAGLLSGHPVAGVGGAGGVAGLYVGSQVLSRILTNPKTARIAVALAGGEPLGVSDQLAGRLIVRALQGSAVALINADGSKTPAVVGPDGIEAR